MKQEELEKQLKEEKLQSIYLLFGEETFLLESALKKIRNLFGEAVQGINSVRMDDTNISSLISEIETPAFGYEKKLIIARNTGIFKKEGRKKNLAQEALLEKISTYLTDHKKEIETSVVLVFVEEAVDKNILYKTLDKIGVVCAFEEQKLPTLMARIKAICKGYQVNIQDAELRYFIELCGTNMQDLINEIRKLIEYTGSGNTITREAIDLLSIKQLDSVIFDLTDQLGKKETAKAMETLHNLIYMKEPVQKILITLYNHFKKLYIVKISEQCQKNVAESLQLKPNQMFLVGKYRTQAKYFTLAELRMILREFTNLDYNSKQGLVEIQIGMESVLCRYCG